MRFPTPSKFLKSAYLRKSYEQKKRFRHVLQAARARWQMPSIWLGAPGPWNTVTALQRCLALYTLHAYLKFLLFIE